MIDLTPLEVRKKKGDFRKAMRGYDPALVDDFLDLVADRMEELVRENMTFSDRVTRLEVLVADYREREKALTEALVSAQEMREETRRQATRDADLLRREAEAEAADIRAAAHQAKENEEDGLRRVRAQRSQLMKSFRAFLERELAELSVAEEALGLRRRGTRGRGASSLTADLFAESDDSDLDDDDDTSAYDAQENVPSGPELVVEGERRPVRARRAPKPVREVRAEENTPEDLAQPADDEAQDVAEFAPAEEPVKARPPLLMLEDADLTEEPELFSSSGNHSSEDDTGARTHDRAKPTSLAALEEEVMRELREQPHSAEKAALLSSVLEEEV
jgi:DivIVA domain-containing protein